MVHRCHHVLILPIENPSLLAIPQHHLPAEVPDQRLPDDFSPERVQHLDLEGLPFFIDFWRIFLSSFSSSSFIIQRRTDLSP